MFPLSSFDQNSGSFQTKNIPDTLPPGTYIFNNGPKKKSVGGRFTFGNHAAMKKLFKDFPGVVFTEKPEKADYVIVPEGVTEVGSKLRKRNPSLANPAVIFPMDKISHVFKAESYKQPKRNKKTLKKTAYQYEILDASGNKRNVDVPIYLEPTGKAQFLNPNYVKSLESVKNVIIPYNEYITQRNIQRPDLSALPPPQLTLPIAAPSYPIPSAPPQREIFAPPPLPPAPVNIGSVGSAGTTPLPSAPPQREVFAPVMPTSSENLKQLIQNSNAFLDMIASGQTGSTGPNAPTPISPTAPSSAPNLPSETGQVESFTAESTRSSITPQEVKIVEGETRKSLLQLLSGQIKVYNKNLKNLKTYTAQDMDTIQKWQETSQKSEAPDSAENFFLLAAGFNKLYLSIWKIIYELKSLLGSDFSLQDNLTLGAYLEQKTAETVPQSNAYTVEFLYTQLMPPQSLDDYVSEITEKTTESTGAKTKNILDTMIFSGQVIVLLLQQLNGYITAYRQTFLTDIQNSNLSLECKDLSSVCAAYYDSSKIKGSQVGGESMSSLTRALFSMSCDLLGNLPNLSKISLEYSLRCQHYEELASTAYEIHRYLLYQGLNIELSGNLQHGPEYFCTTMDDSLNRAYNEMMKLDNIQIPDPNVNDVYKSLQKSDPNDFSISFETQNLSVFLSNVSNYPNLYKAFVSFLTEKNRRQSFDDLQVKMNDLRLDPITTNRLWLYMHAISCVMIMANLCQEKTGFTVARIKEFLDKRYTPDHDTSFVLGVGDQMKQERAGIMRKLKSWFSSAHNFFNTG
jgi:uncharacterized protein YqcC (DUF446 family)